MIRTGLFPPRLRALYSIEMASIPSVLAILLADQVIVDIETKKKTVVGIFDTIVAPQFPMFQHIGFYARLMDMEGRYKFTIRVVHLGETEGGAETLVGAMETGEIQSDDRLATVELPLNLPPVPFTKAGRYEFELFSNDDYIGRATLNVVKQPNPVGG